ncbi:hypothetical protein [Nakamurella endophytica]|uniref:hypothetical protein n=1 Tax=Nakamurella endophytica TaxID=1748367 RepID=UPI00166E2F54|nr:hypothetical protein [Nakamurella endophytica]
MHRRYLRPGWIAGHLLVLLAAVVCVRLGVWQWDRSHAASGTVQNLGYAILWPVFGAAFIYMWIRFLRLEDARDEADAAAPPGPAAEAIDDPDIPPAGPAPRTARPAPSAGTGDATGQPRTAGDRPDRATAADVPPEDATEATEPDGVAAPLPGTPASRAVTVGVGYVGVDDEDDPELAAYNRALAALAATETDKDHRRAR